MKAFFWMLATGALASAVLAASLSRAADEPVSAKAVREIAR